jgi:hypothetical protein
VAVGNFGVVEKVVEGGGHRLMLQGCARNNAARKMHA